MQMLMGNAMMQADMNRSNHEEEDMLNKAIQDSLKENPNPDLMNYEQLQELGEQIGTVAAGFTASEIECIPEYKQMDGSGADCAICLEKI